MRHHAAQCQSQLHLYHLITLNVLLTPTMASSYRREKYLTLQTLPNDSGVYKANKPDDTWRYQSASSLDPAPIALPEDEGQILHCFRCPPERHAKVTASRSGHPFLGLGFAFAGNLVVSMQAFDSVSYNENTMLLGSGGGTCVGPVAK